MGDEDEGGGGGGDGGVGGGLDEPSSPTVGQGEKRVAVGRDWVMGMVSTIGTWMVFTSPSVVEVQASDSAHCPHRAHTADG